MKRWLKNLLWLLVLIACAWPHTPAAVAHPRLARPSTQVTTCSPNLQIESVKYLGKNLSKDSVEVTFNGLPPTASGFNNNFASAVNPTVPACATYGVPPVNTFGQGFGGGLSNNLSSQQGFGGNVGDTTQGFGYELTVTITRRFGHQDTGTAKSSNIFRGKITTVVQIPRGAAETDPVKYDVTINTTFGGLARRTLTAQGNGAPALAAAIQTLANSSFAPANQQGFGSGNATPDSCSPSVSITGLSFTPGSGATPDAVTIDWTASHSPSDCFIGPKVAISVEVKRPDNSTGRASTQPGANSVTVNLSGAPAAPVSFIVRVSAETSLGQQFQVNKKGEF